MKNFFHIGIQIFLMVPAYMTNEDATAQTLLMIAIAINSARIVTIIYKDATGN